MRENSVFWSGSFFSAMVIGFELLVCAFFSYCTFRICVGNFKSVNDSFSECGQSEPTDLFLNVLCFSGCSKLLIFFC